MTASRTSIVLISYLLLSASSAFGAWYDDYEAGIKAAGRGDWGTVISRMNAAIAVKPSEGAKEKTYGVIFIAYYPYYYRGVAFFEQGNFAKAEADLERTKGVGALNLGSVESFLRKIPPPATPTPVVVRTPPPTPTPTPVRTPPPTPTPIRTPPPTPPVISTPTREIVIPPLEDTSTRIEKERARGLINQATTEMSSAKQQGADMAARQQFTNGVNQLSRARTLASTARTAADWQRVSDAAEGARLQFEQAIYVKRNPTISPEDVVLAQTKRRVRNALDAYFSGRFADASSQLETLANEQQENAMLWAFLGAARYSKYYIEGERSVTAKRAAEAAFRQAKRSLKELPAAYFSPRIRRFYATVR